MTRALRLALALGAAGCSYDLDALRARDASVVDRPVAPMDTGAHGDLGDPMDAPIDLDVSVADAGTGHVGTCDLDGGTTVRLTPPGAPVPPGGDAGVTLAYAMATDDLQGAPGLPLPTGTVGGTALAGCPTVDPIASPPTRIYRYQVTEGGVVTATTNTQHCTNFDSRVYAIWSCKDQDVANPLACQDDFSDGTDTARCPTCGTVADAGGNCSTLLSTLVTPASQRLARGDVVFFAVTGFDVGSGSQAHRLWVGENAARIETYAGPPNAVNRCVCQTTTGAARTALFPYMNGGSNFPPTASTASGPVSFLGVRDLPTGSYSGVSLQLRILRSTLSTEAACSHGDVRAFFDLIAGGALVTSFSIGADLTLPATVTVPYTAFAPTVLTRGSTGLSLELRLREVRPQASCLTLDLDPAAGGSAVTLYGG